MNEGGSYAPLKTVLDRLHEEAVYGTSQEMRLYKTVLAFLEQVKTESERGARRQIVEVIDLAEYGFKFP